MEEGIAIDAANSLYTKAFTKMWEFKSKNPVPANQANNKAGSRKKEPPYLAFGRRVYKYNKWLTEKSGVPAQIGDAKNEVLTERLYFLLNKQRCNFLACTSFCTSFLRMIYQAFSKN